MDSRKGEASEKVKGPKEGERKRVRVRRGGLTHLGPQPRFGDKLLEASVVCPQNGTAALKGLRWGDSTNGEKKDLQHGQ